MSGIGEFFAKNCGLKCRTDYVLVKKYCDWNGQTFTAYKAGYYSIFCNWFGTGLGTECNVLMYYNGNYINVRTFNLGGAQGNIEYVKYLYVNDEIYFRTNSQNIRVSGTDFGHYVLIYMLPI